LSFASGTSMRSGKAKSLCAICGDRRVPDPNLRPENLVVFHTGVFVMLATLLVAAFFAWP
jgi:hypothetical protein